MPSRSLRVPLFFVAFLAVALTLATRCAYTQDTILWDFESGELDPWKLVEGENSKPIGSRDVEFHNNSVPYQKSGKFYLTTLESTQSDAPTDGVRCVIESPVFRIEGDAIRFLVGGAGKRDDVRVELAILDDEGNASSVQSARGDDSQTLREVLWNVSALKGKRAFLRVVDQATGPWAHIRCDAFRIDGVLDPDGDSLRDDQREKVAEEARRREAQKRQDALDALPDAILYVSRRQYLPDHHNTATIFQRGEINENSFVGGSKLVVWFPHEDRVQTLLELPEGIVRDPCLSFDASKVLVSIRKSKLDDYHIAELDLDLARPAITLLPETTDEEIAAIQGFRQLTFVVGASDIDPAYLPSGEIVFSSTREPKYCMCNRHIMCNLHKMNADGSNVEQIGKSTLFEGHAALLSDGRVLYDRWEYVDRNFGDAQGVWVANPDGTKHEIYWGNNTSAPGGVIDARPLPDDDSKFVCVFGSCHDRPWGAIALVDRRLGVDGRKPVVQTWPPETIEWTTDEPAADPFKEAYRYDTFSRSPRKYEDPFPLDDGFILAAGQVRNDDETGIYVLDPDGGATLVHVDEPGCFDPIPIYETPVPREVANRVNTKDEYGYFYVSNVYEGFGMENVKPGSVKYLRVVESPEKRFWTHTDWQGSGTQAPGMAWDDFNNKRILGTVPVAEDGSVSFAVPAEKFVYFQLLDENQMMIQSMRSGIMARPGETNACLGCHESRVDAPLSSSIVGSAAAGEPQKLEPWFGKLRLFSYYEEVQPVFDKYCVQCHDVGEAGGEKLLLNGDRNLAFNVSYWELRSKGYVRVPGAGPHNVLPPNSWGAAQSKLAQIFLNGHDDAQIDEKRREMGIYIDAQSDVEAFRRVATWLDLNAPYYPTYASAYRDNPYGRSPLTQEETRRLTELTGLQGNALAAAVFLDRPELSPCLDRWSAAKARVSKEYDEALAIIRAGKARLDRQGRGEEADFEPVADVELDQEKRYRYFQRRAQTVRDAKINGQSLNDRQIDALVGDSWRW